MKCHPLLALAAGLTVPSLACGVHRHPVPHGSDAGLAEATDLLESVSGAMKSFHRDTGG
jgi:hypothetical protein